MAWEAGWENAQAITVASLQVTAGDPGIDTSAAGTLALGSTNANAVNIDPAVTIDTGPLTLGTLNYLAAAGQGLDTSAAGQLVVGPTNATSVAIRGPQKALLIGNAIQAFGAGAQTMTAAQLLGGVITGVPTASIAFTTDTGANIDAAVTGAAVGDTFTCLLVNLSAGAFTITITAAASGITLAGNTAAVAQNKAALMIFRRTGAGAWTVYIVQSL